MVRLIGRSQSTPAVSSNPEAKVKKSKSFKRIRGLLKGESRKERRARKAAEKAAKNVSPSTAEANDDDDQSTVFGVDVDERSTVASINVVKNESSASLLDEKKEEKNNKAYILKVVLLLMDPETRRFELLQLEFDSHKALVSDVLAQIPVSVTEEALRVQNYTGIAGRDGQEMEPNQLLASFCKGNEVLVAVPDGVPPKECIRLARPILSDNKVIAMLANSEIDASGWKEDAKKKKKIKSAVKTTTTREVERVAAVAEPEQPKPAITAPKKNKGSMAFTIIFIVFVALVLQLFHIYASAPIKPGNTISPGTWLSKCGLLTILPSCDNAYLHFNRQGLVTHYNAGKQITWQMQGAVCSSVDDDDEECEKGMKFEDGKIHIGGKQVSYVVSFVKDVSLSPWPFTETPKLKVWRK